MTNPQQSGQPQPESATGAAEPTQVVRPAEPPQPGSPFGEAPEPTQVVQPVAPGSPGADDQASAIPYAPPPSAADNPAAVQPQGFGQPLSPAVGQPQASAFAQPQAPVQVQAPAFAQPPQSPAFGQPQPQAYGQPQHNPFGQQQHGGYGAPQSGGFPSPQPAFGQQQYGMPPAGGGFAEWGPRVGAMLIDNGAAFVLYLLAIIIGFTGSWGVAVIFYLLGSLVFFGWSIWNRWIQQGNTGQSLGKKVMKLRLVSDATGQPIGAGNAFVRDLAHVIDGLPCYVGFLAPLWDPRKQTWADKIMKTVVLRADGPTGHGGFGQPGGYGAPQSGGFAQPGYPQAGYPQTGGFPQAGQQPGAYPQQAGFPQSGGFGQQPPRQW